MSSVPPNMPPGGAPPPPYPPYPPYDPKANWRAYRDQQRAAQRAQRDAWRAQRHAWKATYYGSRVPSVVGPIILLSIGVIWLLIQSGRIPAGEFWTWYGHWWPVLIIGAGVVMLGEWALDMRSSAPVRRRGSFAGLIVLLAIVGMTASGTTRFAPWMNRWRGDDGNGFFNMISGAEHDNDMPALTAQIPADATVEIDNPRGDIKVNATDGTAIEVQAHEVAFSDEDSEAKNIFSAEAPHLAVNGSSVAIESSSNDKGRVDLTVSVPRSAHIALRAERGDVAVEGMSAGLDLNVARGDTTLTKIAGPVTVHLANNRHDFTANGVDGDLTADGDVNDLTLTGIKGKIAENGEILGDARVQNVTGAVHLHTSVTDLEAASLAGGDVSLDSDDLRMTEARGPVRVTTRSKDVDLSRIYGDSTVEDRDGRIAIEPAGAYAIDARNSKGDVEITLPQNAQETVEGRTRNGDIVTDFALNVSGDTEKTVSGRIGAGGPKIYLSSDNGDLRIKKGSALSAAPPLPATGENTAATPGTGPGAGSAARHLRSSGAPLPQQPVTQ